VKEESFVSFIFVLGFEPHLSFSEPTAS